MPPKPPNPRALEQARAQLDEALAARPDDVGLLILRGRADERTGRYSEAATFFQRAARLCRRSGDRAAEGASLIDCGASLSRAGFDVEAREAYQRAISCYELSGAELATAQARLALVRHELTHHRFRSVRQQLDLCLEPLESHESWDELGWVFDRLVDCTLREGGLEEALNYARFGVEVAARAKDRRQFGLRLKVVGSLHHELGNPSKARGYLKKSLRYLQDPEQRRARLEALLELALLAELQGEGATALDCLEEALEVVDRGAVATERGWVRLQLAEQLSPLDPLRTRRLLEEALELLASVGDPKLAAPAWLKLAIVQGQLGHPEEAGRALDQAWSLFDSVGDVEGQAQVTAARHASSLREPSPE
ncbi:MAG TPA: tetratricopeptide repeat protein [Deltaproteobacteria bacterium]|nr:tetratricopeptide repeat protein [Deltaproteobacteria bacterium]